MNLNGLKRAPGQDDYALTRMELIGLTLVAHGFPPAEIGIRLNASTREVETLLFCAERKLGANNRMHAVAKAVSEGLIGIEV